MLLVAEMMREFSIESTLDESLSELLQEAVLTKEVVGLLIIFQ